jgi:serine/threonine protein kinase
MPSNKVCRQDEDLDTTALENRGYRAVKELGRGAAGRVTLAEGVGSKQTDPPTLYAVKRIALQALNSKERELAWAEAKVLSRLSHPWIIRCEEVYKTKEDLHLVLEYAAKGDLERRLKKAKKEGLTGLPHNEAIRIFAQVAFSLRWLHDQQILHRDLKPSNVLLTAKGDAKLADFGICKVLEKGVDLASTFVGTPRYMCPEVANKESYGRPADYWGLGCLLYEMLMLHPPFQGNSLPTMIMRILSADPDPLPPESPEEYQFTSILSKTKPRYLFRIETFFHIEIHFYIA